MPFGHHMQPPIPLRRMPAAVFTPNASPSPIDTLVASLTRFIDDETEVRKEYPWADRFVMGLPLAPWQRPLRWGREQATRFISSVWRGMHLGEYLVTEMELENADTVRFVPLSNCILDGQQRLHSLELYLTNRLPVEDATGIPVLWQELGIVEQRWFRRRVFTRGSIPLAGEAELRNFYNLVNFGGVAHEARERA